MSDDDGAIRLGVFLLVFSIMALWEMVAPRRAATASRRQRWMTNVGLVVIGALAMRVLVPVTAIWAAGFAEGRGVGLLNQLQLSPATTALVTFVALDLVVWLQHLAFHKVPTLWRLHGVHHADTDIDVTTAIRLHPLEIVLSMLWRMLVVVGLGAPAAAVLLFEVALNGSALFHHANVRIFRPIDRALRFAVVTPDMHRIHHSIIARERASNYGSVLSVWDRMFATYVEDPAGGHGGMSVGLDGHRGEEPARLGWSLLYPFRRHGLRVGELR